MAMTIDELAQRSSTPASTIRLYQTRGLLPPPVKDGRVGYYSDGHLARLRLIDQLQDDGFSLASIRRLVDAWEDGRGLDAVLGLESEVAGPWAAEEPLDLTPEELANRFPAGVLTPELMQRTLRLGLIRFEEGRVVVPSPAFLEIGTALAGLGIPVDSIIDEYEELTAMTATVAARFTELFEQHLWAPVVERGLGADDVRSLTDALGRLRDLAEAVVTLTLRNALRESAEEFVSAQAATLDVAELVAALSGGTPQAEPPAPSDG